MKEQIFFTISFFGDVLHNEYIPAFFEGFIIRPELLSVGHNLSTVEGFSYKLKSKIYNENFLFGDEVKNLNNPHKLFKVYKLKNKINDF